MSAEIVAFPASSANPRTHTALPGDVKFAAVIEALGPGEDGKPTGFAVMYLQQRGNGPTISRREAALFGCADLDDAIEFAEAANAFGRDPKVPA